MKRLAVLAVLAAVFWSVPAFGAESIRVLRNGEEVRLPQGIVRENGTLMMSLEDLAELMESELRQDGSVTALGYRMEDGPVVLEYEQTATLVGDAVYDRQNRKIPLEGKILRKDGKIYLPARTMASALGYTVKWSRAGGTETFSVERPVMPRITLDVVYDKEGQRVTGAIWNREPQTFTYGDDFIVERMTAEGWERMREAEPRDINSIGYGMNSLRKGLSDGETDYTRRLFCTLPAGKYRIGVPFSFYYEGSVPEEAMQEFLRETFWQLEMEDIKKLLEEGFAGCKKEITEDDLWSMRLCLNFYYASQWGKPGFCYDGADFEPDYGSRTNYVLYGEFEVE